MEVKSIVELWREDYSLTILEEKGNIIPAKGSLYVVRSIIRPPITMVPCIRLEEIINPPKQYTLPSGKSIIMECAFIMELFREIQEPMNMKLFMAMIDRDIDNFLNQLE